MSIEKVNKDRLYHLDLIRFIAALYVVFYHYGYRGYAKDNLSILQFPQLEGFSKYGYLGVDLFFIISGFVILLSVKNSNIIDFFISRTTRLYPAYWLCVALTAIVVAFYGGEVFNVSLNQFLFNLTMLNGFFGVEYVDGVYWSLVVELKFYILIGIVLLFKGIKHIRVLGYILLLISFVQILVPFAEAPRYLQIIYYIAFYRWNPYFVAGMFFYLMKSEKVYFKNLIPIILAYILIIKYAITATELRNERYSNAFNEGIVIFLISIFFVVMFLICFDRLNILNKRIFIRFGALTYPLYLIHQNIGFTIFNNIGNEDNKWYLLLAVFIIMLLASFLINKYFEKPTGKYMRAKFTQNNFLIKLKSKLN